MSMLNFESFKINSSTIQFSWNLHLMFDSNTEQMKHKCLKTEHYMEFLDLLNLFDYSGSQQY